MSKNKIDFSSTQEEKDLVKTLKRKIFTQDDLSRKAGRLNRAKVLNEQRRVA